MKIQASQLDQQQLRRARGGTAVEAEGHALAKAHPVIGKAHPALQHIGHGMLDRLCQHLVQVRAAQRKSPGVRVNCCSGRATAR